MATTNIDDIRRANARAIADECGSDALFAEALDRAPGQISHWIGRSPSKNIGRKIARAIEVRFNKPEYWLDKDHSEDVGDPVLIPEDRQKMIEQILALDDDKCRLIAEMIDLAHSRSEQE